MKYYVLKTEQSRKDIYNFNRIEGRGRMCFPEIFFGTTPFQEMAIEVNRRYKGRRFRPGGAAAALVRRRPNRSGRRGDRSLKKTSQPRRLHYLLRCRPRHRGNGAKASLTSNISSRGRYLSCLYYVIRIIAEVRYRIVFAPR
jgi:hypothetical protein